MMTKISTFKITGNNTALCCKTSQQQSWYEGKVSKEWAKTTFPSWHNCIRRIYLWTATKLEEVAYLVFWVVVLGVRRRRAATWARCSRVDSKPLGDGDSLSNTTSAYISEQDGRMGSIGGVAVRRGALRYVAAAPWRRSTIFDMMEAMLTAKVRMASNNGFVWWKVGSGSGGGETLEAPQHNKTVTCFDDVSNDAVVIEVMFTATKRPLKNQQSAKVILNEVSQQLGAFQQLKLRSPMKEWRHENEKWIPIPRWMSLRLDVWLAWLKHKSEIN